MDLKGQTQNFRVNKLPKSAIPTPLVDFLNTFVQIIIRYLKYVVLLQIFF